MYGGAPLVDVFKATPASAATAAELSRRQAVACAQHGLQGQRFVQAPGPGGIDARITAPNVGPVQVLLAQNNGDRIIQPGGPGLGGRTVWPAVARRFYGLTTAGG